MRFVNTTTLQFEDVADSKLNEQENQYAILSHRWNAASDEISFADVHESRQFTRKRGYAKLKGFCELAAQLGYRYAWDDTCCINKGDSSELTEAINSMYRWYKGSAVCIVYLEDVPERSMMDSAWFDRGWTLQELVAPKHAAFYDREWNFIGTKLDLLSELAEKTRVPEDILSHKTSPSDCSIAERMSWAATRETTRIEDRAYSLLGLFGVSMPQIYGERENAFLRLQRAIIQQSKDESIFAWATGNSDHEGTYTGLFAPSPTSFTNSSDVVSTRGSTGFLEANGELSIKLKTTPYSMDTYYAVLNCTRRALPDARLAIFVSRLSTENEYVRVTKKYPGGLAPVALDGIENLKERTIRVSLEPKEPPLNRDYGFWLRTLEPPGYERFQTRLISKSRQFDPDFIGIGEDDHGTAGIVNFHIRLNPEDVNTVVPSWSQIRWIKFGFDEDFNPMLLIANNKGPSRMMSASQLPRHYPGSIPNHKLFEDAVSSGPGSTAYKELFNNRWLKQQGTIPSRSYGWGSGISILKIDKHKGIIGSLKALNLGISVKLVPALRPDTRFAGSNANESPRQIWAVDITTVDGPDPETEVARAEKQLVHDEDWDVFYACCCDGNHDASDASRARKNEALAVKKVLGAEDLEEFEDEKVG